MLAASIFAISNLFRREYRLPNFFTFKPHARRTIQLWNVTLICLLMLGFLAQISGDYSRGWIVLFYVATLAALIVLRYVIVRVTALARAAGLISAQRIFLIGTGAHVGAFVNRYEPWTLGINIVGCRFLTPVAATAPPKRGARRSIATSPRRSPASAASSRTPSSCCCPGRRPRPSSAAPRRSSRCRSRFISVPSRSCTNSRRSSSPRSARWRACSSPAGRCRASKSCRSGCSISSSRRQRWSWQHRSCSLVALLIKLDSPGPIFFVQRRYGFNQQPFRIIKFRTMRTLDDGAVIQQARRDDPRLTRIGRWLRRWNIDEIPQLFNVLTGDMSLVGPRPHALSHDREYERRISLYARRHNVKPGITGWAQINGYRGETDTDEKMRKRVEYDLFYIDNWSLWLDLKIIVRTVLSRTAYRNAY